MWLIGNYINATTDKLWRKPWLLKLWEINRKGEVWLILINAPLYSNISYQAQRFAVRDHLVVNHRLLWHGTNVAVVVAILKSGLWIMPHSGGCVGKGIYFASENSKSAGYGK